MGIFFTPRGSMIKLSSLRSILAPMMVMISIKLATSEISGTPSRVTISSARMVAGIRATTLFFAPLMVTSPLEGDHHLLQFFHLNNLLALSSLFPFTIVFVTEIKGTTYSKYCIYYTTDRPIFPSVGIFKPKKARINLTLTFPFQRIILQLLSRLLPCPNVPMEGRYLSVPYGRMLLFDGRLDV